MPNQPKTKKKSIRIDDALWQAAINTAHERGETVTDVIRRTLTRYVKPR